MSTFVRSVHLRTWKLSLSSAVLLFAVATCFADLSPSSIREVEQNTDRWIELQSQIAKTQSEWKSEKTLLESTIQLLEAEQETLKANLEANRKASEVYVGNRDRMKDSVVSDRAALDSLVEPLSSLEQQLKSLLPRLPEPLLQELEIHLGKLDEGVAETATTPNRVQSLVAALSAIDRFGNSLTLSRSVRPDPNGAEVSIRVLYWGLACGYGIDEANKRAWALRPSAEGWVWQQNDAAYQAIEEMIGNYEAEGSDPKLINLPAAIR